MVVVIFVDTGANAIRMPVTGSFVTRGKTVPDACVYYSIAVIYIDGGETANKRIPAKAMTSILSNG
jgi:hypothetical protein